MTPPDRRRRLPAVDKLLQDPHCQDWMSAYGRAAVVAAARAALADAREALRAGARVDSDQNALLKAIEARLAEQYTPSLRPVINATGVIIHTNLGRAPLSAEARAAVQAIAMGYSSLEYDLAQGQRGSRYLHAEPALCELTGAEAALVVNNNAAALALIVSALAVGREVVVSRGQLVEIGGGFRIPDVLTHSGARLVEVGTTNRTRQADYAAAITPQTAFLLRVHASNFKQIGFVEETPLQELAALARERGVYLVDDLGSGALLPTEAHGLGHEPMPQESIAGGADLVAFSGDKLLGGPQAGIIIGRRALIETLKRHPLARALRADKLCYAALGATLDHYRKGQAQTHIPIWQMITRPLDDIRATAERWAAQLGGSVVHGASTVGGGSLPGDTLPTWLVALEVAQPQALAQRLRAATPPIIVRIADGKVFIDPRTVLKYQEHEFLDLLLNIK